MAVIVPSPSMPGPTVLTWLLLALLLLNGLALLRPRGGALSQAPGSALLLAVLLVASLPLAGPARAPAVVLVIVLAGGGITAALLQPLVAAWRQHGPEEAWQRAGLSQRGGRGFVAMAVVMALLTGLLLALRPYPFEYPGDSVDYLNTFQQLAAQTPPEQNCLSHTWRNLTYWRACTLWSSLEAISPHSLNALLSGWPQRSTIAMEAAVLGLSCFRLLQRSGAGPFAAGLSWLLIAFGLGNQAIAFLVNHALQGSILAAAVFVEACLLVLWWAGRPWRPAAQLLSLPLGLAPLLYLELRLHGAFALTSLVLLFPLPLLLGLRTLKLEATQRLMPRRTGVLLAVSCLLLVGLLLVLRGGWAVQKSSRMIVRWSFLRGLGLPAAQLPVSYLMKAPGSRPELLAVAGAAASVWILSRPVQPLHRDERGVVSPPQVYRELSSLYGAGMLVAFLLPPFSQLFVQLPYEVISNYRLMWGVILFSPLPPLISSALGEGAQPPAGQRLRCWPLATLGVLLTLVLVPFPSGSPEHGQRFWSKSRHLLEGPSGRVDLLRVSSSLLPSLLQAGRELGRPPVVLADELVGTALEGFGRWVKPVDPIRVYSRRDDGYGKVNAVLRHQKPNEMITTLRERPPADVVVQQSRIGNYYTPYGEIGVYDSDIADLVSRQGVNAIPGPVLRRLGFQPWRLLDEHGRIVAAAAAPGEVTYRLWRRTAGSAASPLSAPPPSP